MTPRDRRAMLVGASLIAVMISARVAFAGVTRLSERLRYVAESQGVLTRAAATTEQVPLLRAAIGDRGAEIVALAPMLVPGRSPAEGRANLSTQLTGWALTHHVAIQRLDSAPDSISGSLVRLELVVRAEGDLAGLGRLVAEVERSPMLLTLSRLSLAVEGDPDAEPQRLRAEFAVRGWMLR